MQQTFSITKYEKVRLIGTRALQLSHGAKPMTNIGNLINVLQIAEKEYNEGVIPISILRILPNGEKLKVTILAKENKKDNVIFVDRTENSDSESDIVQVDKLDTSLTDSECEIKFTKNESEKDDYSDSEESN